MSSTPEGVAQIVRRQRLVMVGQLVLTAVVVSLSLAGLSTGGGLVTILGLAAVNASLVAYSAMGLRGQWWPVYVVLGVMAVLLACIFFWPAWNEIARVRFR